MPVHLEHGRVVVRVELRLEPRGRRIDDGEREHPRQDAVDREAVSVARQEVGRRQRPREPVRPRMQQRDTHRRAQVAVGVEAVTQIQELNPLVLERAADHRQVGHERHPEAGRLQRVRLGRHRCGACTSSTVAPSGSVIHTTTHPSQWRPASGPSSIGSERATAPASTRCRYTAHVSST